MIIAKVKSLGVYSIYNFSQNDFLPLSEGLVESAEFFGSRRIHSQNKFILINF